MVRRCSLQLTLFAAIVLFGFTRPSAAETVDVMFRRAIALSGPQYVAVRDELLARADQLSPVLEQARTADDWRTRVMGEILSGWLTQSTSYRELWSWRAPPNRFRNPYPRMAAEAKAKFSAAGKEAGPLMLELVWKSGETQHGAIPQLLAEWQVDETIPVLIEWMKAAAAAAVGLQVPEAIGRFGPRATPQLLAALNDANPFARRGLIRALGLTGDLQAVNELRTRLAQDSSESVRQEAAYALGLLKQFGVLREALPAANTSTQTRVLEVLGDDKSPETRSALRAFATTTATPSLRLDAVRAMLENPTADDLATACDIVSREPDAGTRSNMLLYLGTTGRTTKHPRVRQLCLTLLQDDAEYVRVRAIEALQFYDDPETTQALLRSLDKHDVSQQTALWVLKERQHPAITDAALALLQQPEPVIRQYAVEALAKHPCAKALEPLIGLLHDEDAQVRRLAAGALAQIGGVQALSALTAALPAEKDSFVRDSMGSAIHTLSAKLKADDE